MELVTSKILPYLLINEQFNDFPLEGVGGGGRARDAILRNGRIFIDWSVV